MSQLRFRQEADRVSDACPSELKFAAILEDLLGLVLDCHFRSPCQPHDKRSSTQYPRQACDAKAEGADFLLVGNAAAHHSEASHYKAKCSDCPSPLLMGVAAAIASEFNGSGRQRTPWRWLIFLHLELKLKESGGYDIVKESVNQSAHALSPWPERLRCHPASRLLATDHFRRSVATRGIELTVRRC